MPIMTSLLLLGQAAATPAMDTEAFKKSLAANGDIAGRYIDCMDTGAKDSLKKHIGEASPEVAADEAALICKPIASEMRANTAAGFLHVMSAADARAKADQLTDTWIGETRTKFVSLVDGWLATRALAETRVKITGGLWAQCVRGKATVWAKLKDEASSVATAAVSACRDQQRNFVTAAGYQNRANGIRASVTQESELTWVQTMKDNAIQWVIEARAASASQPASARAQRNSAD